MIQRLIAYLHQWSHDLAMRRHTRKRLAELRQRLIAHEHDMLLMAHYPEPVRERMAAYRVRLLAQIEAVSKHI